MTKHHEEINLTLNWVGDKTIAAQLTLYGQVAIKALNRTVTKFIRSFRYEFQRALAMKLSVPQRVLSKRIFDDAKQREQGLSRGKIWVGLNPVDYTHIAKPVQTKSGVRVGKFNLEHAFLIKLKGKNVKVFMREGKARLPIDKQSLNINETAAPFMRQYMTENAAAINAKFMKIWDQELNYALRVEKS